jgi:predicted metal-dependent enzyme (double-stranded beta helix superfamily)
MQTSLLLQAMPVVRTTDLTEVSESMLDREVAGLSDAIEQACLGEADLVPYRVRQALNHALDAKATERLLKQVLALPHSTQSYTRHILHADPAGMFTVVALRWDTNQASPVHAHYTWCAYRVLRGELTESHFEWDRSVEQAYLFNRVARSAGQSVCGHGGMDFIHRLGNEQAQTAVSIHVYGIDSARISSHVNRKLAVKLDVKA